MSDGKSRAHAADAAASSRSSHGYESGASDPKKGYAEEEYFDSGIQSECLSEVISETDIKYSDSALDCDYDDTRHPQQPPRELPTAKEVDYKLSAQLDSGLDLDCEPQEPSEAPKSKVVKQESASVSKEEVSRAWDAFFEPDDEGNTQLHLAIIQGRVERALLILSRIPESRYLDLKNHRRETCLHLSVLVNMPYITRKLLLAGAQTGLEDANGNTPLHLACKTDNLKCVDALLNRASIAHDMTCTIFMYMPKIDLPHKYINEWNYDGLASVHLAAAHKDFNILYQLFVNGCDVNIRECKGGYTILHTAVRSGRVDLVKFILEYKQLNNVNTEVKNYARLTAYQLSAYYPQIANILAENGAVQLSTADDSEDDSSDESSDDESFGNSDIDSTSQMMNSLMNAVLPPVITTAS